MSHGAGCLCTGLQIGRFKRKFLQRNAIEPDKSPEESWPGSSTCNSLHPAQKTQHSGAASKLSVHHGTAQHRTERQSMTPYRFQQIARSSPVIAEAVQLRSGGHVGQVTMCAPAALPSAGERDGGVRAPKRLQKPPENSVGHASGSTPHGSAHAGTLLQRHAASSTDSRWPPVFVLCLAAGPVLWCGSRPSGSRQQRRTKRNITSDSRQVPHGTTNDAHRRLTSRF